MGRVIITLLDVANGMYSMILQMSAMRTDYGLVLNAVLT